MCNDFACSKRIVRNAIIVIIIIISVFYFKLDTSCQTANAESVKDDSELETEFSNNIDNILNDIDTNELNDFIANDFNLSFFEISDFKDLAKKILNGDYFNEYDDLFDGIKSFIKNEFKSLFKIFLVFLVLVLMYELFNNLCSDKYKDLNKIIKILFLTIIGILLISLFKQIADDINSIIQKIFLFSKIIFPILLSLILISGSVGTYSVYSSLSLFLLNTGSYMFTYFLVPVAISIFVLSLCGSIVSTNRFSKVIDIFKSIFKYSIIIFFGIFGLFSSVNVITSGVKDGVSVRLTKYAIKNYIPIVGGYVSQGFDFIHSCSVVIKNAFGVCGILTLLLIVLKPLLIYFVYLLMFKILSAVVALVGNTEYSDMFNNVSKSISYFIAILVGLFFIIFVFIYLLIISVSVI